MRYVYFISYCSHGNERGRAEITRSKKITSFDDIESLELNLRPDGSAVITNYILMNTIDNKE